MQTKQLGCLSGTGIISGWLTLMILGGVWLLNGGVMFSPGPLNARAGSQALGGVFSHAETNGRCSACHTAIWERASMADRCLVCHLNLLQDGQDFHSVMLAQGQEVSCLHCHTDHRGADFSLTLADMEQFPHLDAAGFSLQAHQVNPGGSAFTCADCHGDEIAHFELAACGECHGRLDKARTDAHRTAFGNGCLDCHDGKETIGKKFDHNQTGFQLAGVHAGAGCAACHAGARSLADLRDTSQDCYACHAKDDEHNGQFGTRCAACHNPEDWEQVAFDHAASAFPLTGKHQNADCETCHQDGIFKGTPQDCASCHSQDDKHNGQFGPDCAACHTTTGWEAASFDHTLASFALTGAHIQVECAQCHTNQVFQGTPTACSACHADPEYHRDLFGSNCENCHNTGAWVPAAYDEPHRFPINHGDSRNSCQVCHPTMLSAYTCYGCHEHTQANIAGEHREEGISDFNDCVRCHATGQKEEGEGGGGDD